MSSTDRAVKSTFLLEGKSSLIKILSPEPNSVLHKTRKFFFALLMSTEFSKIKGNYFFF